MTQKYEQLGVSSDKPDVHAAIANQDRGLFPGAFCTIVPDPWGTPEDCLVVHADGAGTKSNVAYLSYRETGDPNVLRGIAQDSIVMNTDDVLCVGATGPFVVSSTINRNAHRFGADALRQLIEGHSDFANRMREQGIPITLAGGETADVGDLTATVVVDSTVVARMQRHQVINCANIQQGNVIVGLASAGQATYEDEPNSGIASNGLTFARHALLSEIYAQRYPETFSTTLIPQEVYNGPYQLDDLVPGSSQTIGQALLSPTRTYLPVAAAIIPSYRPAISGIIHNTGGGQVKCQRFGTDLHFVKDNLPEPPPIFQAIEQASGASRKDLRRVFNMGVLLEVYCEPEIAPDIVSASERLGIEAQVIGRVEASNGPNRVTLSDRAGTYEY